MPQWVRAAGGVVWRMRDTSLEVLLVHRPRYDDWSFPKGKNDPGEDDEACALREVLEETGLRCVLGRELAAVAYRDARARPKRVRYWEMRVVTDEGFEANDEIDGRRWVDLATAAALLTYPHDREVLASFAAFAEHPSA